MKKIYIFGKMKAVVYWKAGAMLDDISLKNLHCQLLKVNQNSGANIIHKMLESKSSLLDIRELLKETVISIFLLDEVVNAFLVSPILIKDTNIILHTGLMVVEKNPGINLMGFLFLINARMAYEKKGFYFVTNITSTPSAVENFSELVPGAWPGPDAKLKRVPKGYKDILKKLKSDYLDIYFPDTVNIELDYKRFVMKSRSSAMGFTTSFHKISCANNFKYNNFCHTWINYEMEEDVIQVGEINWSKYL